MEKTFFELLSDPTSTVPCYFSDIKTRELLYMNDPMCRMFSVEQGSYFEKKCHEVLQSNTEVCGFCPSGQEVLEQGVFREFYIFTSATQTYIKSLKTLVCYQGREVEMAKLFETDSNYVPLSKITYQQALDECVKIFSEKEREKQLQGYLNLLLEYYQCDRSFYYVMNQRNGEVQEVVFEEREKAPTKLPEHTHYDHEKKFFAWASTGGHLKELSMNMISTEKTQLCEDEVEFYRQNDYNNFSIVPIFSQKGELSSIFGMLNRRRKLEGNDQSLLQIVAQFAETSEVIQQNLCCPVDNNFKDHLTGTFNREKYNQAVQLLKFEQAKDVGVVFINVNGLKKTNQFYGLEAGDKLIQDSISCASEIFSLPWFRLSGDEFICFVTQWTELEFNEKVDLLHNELGQMSQRLFALGSAWKNRTNDIDKLVETADAMMFIDKQTFYTEFDPNKMEFSDQVLQDLLVAVQEEEFLVYLQPKVDLKTEEVVGAEALIRRYHKKLEKMVFPDQFIPLYEKKSIIRHVDLFVLRKVCMLLQEWNQLGRQMKISVNLSRVTLLEHGIVHKFADICDEYQVPHQQIVVEVTERVGLIENDVESPLIEQFKQYGFKISLDDFGCAYSNIVTLAQIDVDEVKIDKSLVDNILINHKNRSIVENMIRMVDSFGDTATLAEGVETREQADCLRDCNCRYVQGYFYSRPIPNEAFFETYISNK